MPSAPTTTANADANADANAPIPSSDPSPVWFCKACGKQPGLSPTGEFKRCARCRLVRYCSVECQRSDFASHKAFCKQLSALQRHLRPRCPFEQYRGHVVEVPGGREYCRKLAEMGHELEKMAESYNVAPLLEKSLESRLELLRLDADDHFGMYELVPFTMLRLHRDDRCVAFIGHWLRRMYGGLDPTAQHEASQRGDWLYGEADRFDDVFGPANMTEFADAPIWFLIALCIVKLRIIARWEGIAPPQGLETRQAYHEERVPEHLLLCERYFDAIHRRNPTLLPALINPAPLHARPTPKLKKLGGPSEAYFTLLSCYELFVSVPGAVDRLVRRFGPDPEYDCEMYSHW